MDESVAISSWATFTQRIIVTTLGETYQEHCGLYHGTKSSCTVFLFLLGYPNSFLSSSQRCMISYSFRYQSAVKLNHDHIHTV